MLASLHFPRARGEGEGLPEDGCRRRQALHVTGMEVLGQSACGSDLEKWREAVERSKEKQPPAVRRWLRADKDLGALLDALVGAAGGASSTTKRSPWMPLAAVAVEPLRAGSEANDRRRSREKRGRRGGARISESPSPWAARGSKRKTHGALNNDGDETCAARSKVSRHGGRNLDNDDDDTRARSGRGFALPASSDEAAVEEDEAMAAGRSALKAWTPESAAAGCELVDAWSASCAVGVVPNKGAIKNSCRACRRPSWARSASR